MKKLLGLLALTAAVVLSPAALAQMPSCTPSNNCYVFTTSGNGTSQVTAIPPGTTSINVQIVSTGVTVAGTAQIQTAATISGGALVSPVSCGSSQAVATAAGSVASLTCSVSGTQPWAYVGVNVSGVTGTTSGDSLWFTSSLAGRLSAARPIQQIKITGTTTGALTFASIPQGYSALLLVANGAVSDASASVAINCEFNGDTTAADYGGAFISGGAAAVTAGSLTPTGTTGIPCFSLPGSSAPTSAGGGATVTIPGYASGTLQPVADGEYSQNGSSTFGSLSKSSIVATWKGPAGVLAPITSLTLTDNSGGHFLPGTTFTLYGLQ